jgi:hypothetical protein
MRGLYWPTSGILLRVVTIRCIWPDAPAETKHVRWCIRIGADIGTTNHILSAGNACGRARSEGIDDEPLAMDGVLRDLVIQFDRVFASSHPSPGGLRPGVLGV